MNIISRQWLDQMNTGFSYSAMPKIENNGDELKDVSCDGSPTMNSESRSDNDDDININLLLQCLLELISYRFKYS